MSIFVEPVTTMNSYAQKLQGVVDKLRAGAPAEPVTVRELLGWFGAQRRGSNISYLVRDALEGFGLTTRPDFEGAYIDSLIGFALADEGLGGSLESTSDAATEMAVPDEHAPNLELITPIGHITLDPTNRIGKLKSANILPTCVAPNQTVQEAISIMLLNDFSQLPVMVGERDVKGIVSWASIGSRLVDIT